MAAVALAVEAADHKISQIIIDDWSIGAIPLFPTL